MPAPDFFFILPHLTFIIHYYNYTHSLIFDISYLLENGANTPSPLTAVNQISNTESAKTIGTFITHTDRI